MPCAPNNLAMGRRARTAAPRLAVFVALLALACSAYAGGDVVSVPMLMRAVVQKRASVTHVVSPREVRVTPEDLARGYVDVPTLVQVEVRSNSADGFLLTFELQQALLRGAQVAGLAAPLELGSLPGSIRQPALGAGMATRTLQMHLIFRLAAGAAPGVYDWPLRISAEPI
ncbi:MAG TPA: hypothetical protein VIE63_14770 [Ramlibacter sp.]|jgi:hypothetical protein